MNDKTLAEIQPKDKAGETIALSELTVHCKTNKEANIKGEPAPKEKPDGDNDHALAGVAKRKGKVIIHCLRHAQVRGQPNSQTGYDCAATVID